MAHLYLSLLMVASLAMMSESQFFTKTQKSIPRMGRRGSLQGIFSSSANSMSNSNQRPVDTDGEVHEHSERYPALNWMLRTPKPSTFETNDNGQRETIMTSAAKAASLGNTVHDYDGHDLDGFELESGPQAFDRLEPSLNQINQNLGQLQQTIMANYRKPIRPFRMLNDNQSE